MEDEMRSRGGAAIATPDDVAQLYTLCAHSLQRVVAGGVRASDVVVEDACQVAWSRLVRDRHRVRRESAFGWLVRTAIHEAYRLARREGRDLSLEVLVELEDGAEWEAMLGSDPTDDLTAHVTHVEALRALPPRQQRLVWLRGCGLSYAEIANATGDTERTVERQLVRAQRRLSALGAS
jgi:RNA polymerase sigma factor (sigma-70 family)